MCPAVESQRMSKSPKSGGTPETFGKCTNCGSIYSVQCGDDGDMRPVGTDGACACGNDEFAPPEIE
jgi:hypothetical protein